ncbi:MAG: methyltransferase domain-containing protein [Bacteroidales bacterium]|nr:methyltransferase domain-containing protein [Bacteroidales bacterium]
MEKQHTCPWWLGYTFILPIRKLKHNPQKLLSEYVKEGMTVMDFGCAMGYFSIPLAQMVGKSGTVYCVDMQEKLIRNLVRRARKYNVEASIKPLLVNSNYHPEQLKNTLDFALLFAVVHEVPDKTKLFQNIYAMLKPGAILYFAEPSGHVSFENFNESVQIASKCGFKLYDITAVSKKLRIALQKSF